MYLHDWRSNYKPQANYFLRIVKMVLISEQFKLKSSDQPFKFLQSSIKSSFPDFLTFLSPKSSPPTIQRGEKEDVMEHILHVWEIKTYNVNLELTHMMGNLDVMPQQSVSGVDPYDGESGSHASSISIWSWPIWWGILKPCLSNLYLELTHMMGNQEAIPQQSVSGVGPYDGESRSHASAISIWSWLIWWGI